MGGGRPIRKRGRNPKKKRHDRKPPLKRAKVDTSPAGAGIDVEDASVEMMSVGVVEDASIDLSLNDDDSCFDACLASNEPYDGPVDCSLQGSSYPPVVDCSFLVQEQAQQNKSDKDAMGIEKGTNDRMECELNDLVDTESENGHAESRTESVMDGSDNGQSSDSSFSISLNDSSDDSDDSCSNHGSDSEGNDHFAFTLSNDCCNNCRRKRTVSGPAEYQVALRTCRVVKARFRRRFSNYSWVEVFAGVEADRSERLLTTARVARSRAQASSVSLKLCRQCQDYLTSTRSKNTADVVWPAMVWRWLSSEITVLQYGNGLWGLIPELWRPWWLDSVRKLHPTYRQVTLQDPPCSFVDRSAEKEELERAIAVKHGGFLAAACRKHLYSVVWCPWGEMEYLHQCGSLALDLVVTRLLGDCMQTIKGNVRNDLQKVAGISEHFLDGKYERLLSNPEWEVRPTIVFENRAPVVLTCRKHRSGCSGRYLHMPRNPRGVLPSLVSDQLTPAVVRPRNLKQLKKHQFSDSYQMREMQGQYNGVDTVQICDHHNFAADSKILREREEVSLSGRTDLRALLGEWGQKGILPPDVAESRLVDADRYGACPEEVGECCRGATFITLADSLTLQKMNKSSQSRVIRVKEEGEWSERHYVPPWPGCLINVHPFDEYGASFPILPKMYDGLTDIRLAFYLAAMHATVPSLWESSNNSIETAASWEGWLLSYLGRKCFPSCRVREKKNPFKFKRPDNQVESLAELLIHIGLRKDLRATHGASLGSSEDDESIDEEASVSTSSSSLGWNVVTDYDNDSMNGWNEDDFSDDDISMNSQSDDDSSMGWASDNPTIQLNTDGLFHPADLEQLFEEHLDVEVASYTDIATMLGRTSDETKCLIIYRAEDPSARQRSNMRLETELRCRLGECWDLRFVGGCNVAHTDDRFILARHGGVFPAWWKQTYRNKRSYDFHREQLCNNRISTHCQGWDVAVYVRRQSVPLDECRDVILRSMGSQTNVFCQEHDIPLITAPFSTDVSCCLTGAADGTPCSKSITLRCPVKSCESALCKTHEGQAVKTHDRLYVGIQNLTMDIAAAADNSDSDDGDDGIDSQADSLFEIASVLDDDEMDYFADAVEEASVTEEKSDDCENILDCEMFADARDDLVLDVNCDANVPVDAGNPDVQAYGETDIPVTCDQEEPLTVKGDPSSISGCCVLNNVGSLLVRKGAKLRGSMNQRFFLQRIVATTPGQTVPLVYPEAMLFPSLFWKDADEGAMLGAIPSALLAHDSTLQRYGIASMQSHLYARLTNPTLGTSTDPRYLCYAFDAMANLGCRHEDVRVILHRGVTGSNDGVRVSDSGPGNVTDKSFFDTDSVDSRPTVNKLAAAVAEKQATYFYTHTANALDHFGLCDIKRWIDGDAVIELICDGTETTSERDEIRRSLRQSASVVLLRNWVEVSILYMDYIANSEEKPLGDVEHIWWRFEFQDSVGNLPHIHALIWLRDGEPLEMTHDRIRGSIMELIRPDEIDKLIADGFLANQDEVMTVRELAARLLVHICSSRCKRRVSVEDGELRCRATDNEAESPDPKVHSIRTIHVEHSDAAVKVLADVGLFVLDEDTQTFEPAVDVLTATKHYPPANNSEGIISACSGCLFTLGLSSDNLKEVTGYLASRYLAKYLALIDENNRVYIGSMSRERNTVRMEQVTLHNTKITGSAIQEAKRDAARQDRKHPTGRAISHMEMLCVVLGYDQVYTNLRFVHVPTVPLEERPAFDRKRPFARLKEEKAVPESAAPKRPQDLDAADVIASYKVRNLELDDKLPLWRQVGMVESLVLRDQCLAPQTVDAITLFGIRPPELRFVRRPCLYFRWFYRDTERKKRSFKKVLDAQREAAYPVLEESCWVDGSDCRVYVRPFAVREILEYLNHGDPETGGRRSHESFYSADAEDDGLIPGVGTCRQTVSGETAPPENPWSETAKLFAKLNANLENPPRRSNSPFSRAAERWELMKARLVGPAERGVAAEAPIIWYNSIKPTQPARWLIHILLSMGEFDCETNLLGHGDMVENFERARLISADTSCRDDDIKKLVARYVLEQLVFLPGGAKQFDRHTVAADHVLRQALIEGSLPREDQPATLYTHIREEQDKKSRAHMLSTRKFLATTIMKDLRHANMMSLPDSVDDVVNATVSSPLNWKPELVKSPGQSLRSFEEQKAALNLALKQFDKYQLDTTTQTKNMLIIGGPGAGKTTVMQVIGLLSLCRGFNTGLGTNMSERGRQLGGCHFNEWFCIPVNERAMPARLAELAIARLMRCPAQLALIRSLEVFLIDEFGQVSAETVAVIDIILRRVRNSNDFMGGVLIFATLDECQLRPVEGRPPLLSPHILTSFVFCGLEYSVRAAHDPNLRRIIEITRLPKRCRTAAIRREFKELVATKCTFVDNWDHPLLKMDILRVFAKHRARADAERRLLAKMKEQYRDEILCAHAADYESSRESNWVTATSATTRLLTQKVKEPQQLYFYPHATYEITFNRKGHFSQSQLAVLAEMPSADDVRELRPVSVFVAPEGMKAIPSGLITENDFVERGFQKRQIGVAPERTKHVGLSILAKRRQIGLRHRLASTIHAAMGQDLPKLVTSVTGDSMYELFQREQVVVLLSRTHYARDIIFVGDPMETAEALAAMLDKDGPYSEYMEYLVRKLVKHSPERGPSVDLTSRHPYYANNVEVPNDNSGFCYVLASLARGVEGRVTYIGQARNLILRFGKHKLGAGPEASADAGLKPWAMLAYVSGFEGAIEADRQYFERLWEAARDGLNAKRRRQNMRPLDANEVADLANTLVTKRAYRNCIGLANRTLVFVRCGRFSSG